MNPNIQRRCTPRPRGRASSEAAGAAPKAVAPAIALGLSILFLTAASACAPRTSTRADLDAVVAAPNVTTTVQEISRQPERFVGRSVTVSGEVGKVLGPRWFTVGGEEFDGAEILVLGRSTVPGILSDLADSGKVMNDIVQVTGVVRTFEEDALEREIGGGLDLDGDLFDLYDQHPVIVMSDLDLTPRVDVVRAVAVPVPVPVAVAPPIVDEVIILDTPDRKSLTGRSVALVGVQVQAVNNAYSFWIGPDTGRRVLVVLDSTTSSMKPGQNYYAMPKPGQSVAVAGVLQPIPQNLDEVQVRWGLTPLDRARLAVSQVYLAANRVMVLDGR